MEAVGKLVRGLCSEGHVDGIELWQVNGPGGPDLSPLFFRCLQDMKGVKGSSLDVGTWLCGSREGGKHGFTVGFDPLHSSLWRAGDLSTPGMQSGLQSFFGLCLNELMEMRGKVRESDQHIGGKSR